MINLLPQPYLRELRREQLRRVFVVCGLLAIIVAFVNITLLFPPLLFLRFREASIEREIAIANQAPEIQRASGIEQRITELNAHLGAFERNEKATGMPISQLFEPALLARDHAIAITSLTFLPSDENRAASRLLIRGSAETRNALLRFADRLKTEHRYSSVVLPVENLLRDRDILFSLTVDVRE